MCITEFNEETYKKGIFEEGWEEGLEEGRREGALDTLLTLAKEKLLSIDEAAKRAGLTVADFQKQMNKI